MDMPGANAEGMPNTSTTHQKPSRDFATNLEDMGGDYANSRLRCSGSTIQQKLGTPLQPGRQSIDAGPCACCNHTSKRANGLAELL